MDLSTSCARRGRQAAGDEVVWCWAGQGGQARRYPAWSNLQPPLLQPASQLGISGPAWIAPAHAAHLRILLKQRGVGGVGLNVQPDGGARGAGAAAEWRIGEV